MSASHLHKNFTNELFKSCLRNRSVFELTMTHMKYTYLADENQKSIWQAMVQYYQGADKLLTIGLLSQMFVNEPKVISIISDIKEADEPDENNHPWADAMAALRYLCTGLYSALGLRRFAYQPVIPTKRSNTHGYGTPTREPLRSEF